MKINTELKYKGFALGCVLLGSIIGIFGQGMTYYIVNHFFESNVLLSCLTILTIISVVLFLIPAILIWSGIKKLKLSKQVFNKYLILDSLIGGMVSLWSMMVLIAWYGAS